MSHTFSTSNGSIDIDAEDETSALNIAERMSDDDLVSEEEKHWAEYSEEQPELDENHLGNSDNHLFI